MDDGDAARWVPSAAVLFCVAAGWTWWTSMVARGKSPLREPRIVASLAFVAVTSVFCGVARVDDPSVSIGLLSVVVTGLGMIGLFFIPAASSRPLPARHPSARDLETSGPGRAGRCLIARPGGRRASRWYRWVANNLRRRLEDGLDTRTGTWGLETVDMKFSVELEAVSGVVLARASVTGGFAVTPWALGRP
jgi:hypothetical protein